MAAPNWSADPTGVEPSLGYAIDQHEPVGEYGEVAQSLDGNVSTDDGTATPRIGASPTLLSSSSIEDLTRATDASDATGMLRQLCQ
jgi:hypothetical protein